METTTSSKGLSTLKEIIERIEGRKSPILRIANDHDGLRNIVTFVDGSQANVTQEDGWMLHARPELWKGGPAA